MTSKESNQHEYFSLRRLAPYRGTLHVVDIGEGQAVSQDGEDWEIHIHTERPADLWASPGGPSSRFPFLYGHWHRKTGLDRVPVNPILNNARIIPTAERLLDYLQQVAERVPFPARDQFELWLLDEKSSLPLALLASALSLAGIERSEYSPQWTPVTDDWRGRPLAKPLREYAGQLARRVAAAAGPSPSLAWFRRTTGGNGRLLAAGTHPGTAGKFPASAFPELLCRAIEIPAAVRETRAERYLTALAPRLLMLPDLRDAYRSRLERMARQNALEVAAHWRLYPKIIHRDLLRQTLVEARLRSTGAG